ncbi:MAG: LacI family DNA-binding transcriptional regulator [Gleimia sp.]|jgi:DNA-binding LacI/PurR family transcriptional regulator
MRKVTMRDVAEKAGVSISTVSLALRNDERITPETRQDIHTLARKMGYQRDITGTLLRTDKPRIIGVVGQLNQELHSEYVARMHELADKENFQLISQDASVYGGYEGAFNRLAQLRVSNLIAVNPCLHDGQLPAIVPSVVIGQTSPFEKSDVVRSANEQGMLELTEHLAKLGHKQVLYLDGPPGISAQYRRDAVRKAAAQSGIEVDVLPSGNTMDEGFGVGRELADRGVLAPTSAGAASAQKRPTALLCYNDQCAQGAIIALNRAGICVPSDVSVAGFDNSSIAASKAFDLTSVDRGVDEVSALAINLAIGRHKQPQLSPRIREVPTKLIVRGSTAVAASG